MSISTVHRKPDESPPKGDSPEACVSARSQRRLRRATLVLATLVALPALAIIAVLLGLNPLVKKRAEALASSALRVPVAIDHARVNLAGGVHLYRPAIGNPRGFKEVRALRLERVDAAVTLPSLFGQTIEVQDLLLVHPELTVEFNGDKTNLGALLDNLAAAAQGPPKDGGKKFIIRRIRIVHPVVIVRSTLIPKGAAIHLRDIDIQDVGTAPGSASPTSLVLATILQAIITGAINEWTGIPGELSGLLEKDVSRAAKPFQESITPARK
jgi:hypothetical protein